MQTSIALDYLSATTKLHSLSQVVERFAFGMEFDKWVTAKALNGYEQALRHPYGHIISWTSKRDDMGINVLFTGMPLKELNDRGHNNFAMLRALFEAEFRFSRIDLAIDIHDIKIIAEFFDKDGNSLGKIDEYVTHPSHMLKPNEKYSFSTLEVISHYKLGSTNVTGSAIPG